MNETEEQVVAEETHKTRRGRRHCHCRRARPRHRYWVKCKSSWPGGQEFFEKLPIKDAPRIWIAEPLIRQ